MPEVVCKSAALHLLDRGTFALLACGQESLATSFSSCCSPTPGKMATTACHFSRPPQTVAQADVGLQTNSASNKNLQCQQIGRVRLALRGCRLRAGRSSRDRPVCAAASGFEREATPSERLSTQ